MLTAGDDTCRSRLALTPGSTTPNHGRLLNTIGTAVGLRKSDGAPIDNFGDPSLNRTPLDEMRA